MKAKFLLILYKFYILNKIGKSQNLIFIKQNVFDWLVKIKHYKHQTWKSSRPKKKMKLKKTNRSMKNNTYSKASKNNYHLKS